MSFRPTRTRTHWRSSSLPGRRRSSSTAGLTPIRTRRGENRLRGTAAHSTVGIDEDDSAEVYGTFRLGRRPRKVVCERTDDEAGARAGGSHDGYGRYGLIHHRRLILADDGRRLTGMDRIEGMRRDHARRLAAARFHLHPDVAVAPGDRDDELRLSLPGQGHWSFAAPGETVRVADSVYAPHFGEMCTSRQIVVEKPLETSDTILEWGVRRKGRRVIQVRGSRGGETRITPDWNRIAVAIGCANPLDYSRMDRIYAPGRIAFERFRPTTIWSSVAKRADRCKLRP